MRTGMPFRSAIVTVGGDDLTALLTIASTMVNHCMHPVGVSQSGQFGQISPLPQVALLDGSIKAGTEGRAGGSAPQGCPSQATHQVGVDWRSDSGCSDGDRRDLVASFGAQGMPATVIYDAAGNVADVRLGVVGADELRSLLAELFDVS